MSYASLPQCFLDAVDHHANPRALIYRAGESWQSISSTEFLRRVAALSHALAELGVRTGERVVVFAANRPEWHIADLAVLGLGGVTVPIYFRESQERMAYILNDCGAKVAIAAGEQQVRGLADCMSRAPQLEHLIAAGATASSPLYLAYETLIASGGGAAEIAEYRRSAVQTTPEQLATIIYTSGTTGEPKGVMLSHFNLSTNAADTFRDYGFLEDEVALSFLPLSHVYERTLDYGYLFRGISIAYVEQMEQVPQALLAVRPTVAAAVPRFFEKVYANIMEQAGKARGLRRKLFELAMRVSRDAVPWKAYGKPAALRFRILYALMDRLVFAKIRAGVGGRIRSFTSGSAPLGRELAEFFWSVGLPVYEGYGLTETSPVATANVPGAFKVGSVGRPIANVEVRIAEDGEILVRGACVMQGYYGKAEATREAFTADGWLRTGDIGRVDEDGYLTVTDRKKELLKTAAGKFVAPQPIENLLKRSPYISNAIVVGDRRRFVSVLVVPNFAAVERKGREAGVAWGSQAELAADSWVHELMEKEMQRLTAVLAQYERPKRFAILGSEFSFDSGELTYTLKLKRRIIEERYREVIDRLYAVVEEPHPPPHL